MYLTAFMQVTRLGCEIPRSKECPTNPLTVSQTTNFRLFQTESVCRRQFQI